ncbi:MAG: hypothetical protein E7520_04855 [Ruminococcaceae bacterium]|nr:hypothetical protein [Oscillospiraceae bacterium]
MYHYGHRLPEWRLNMEENREIEIDLRKIVYMMRDKLIYIFLITILGGVLLGAFTQLFITPTYTATVKFFAKSSTSQISTSSTKTEAELNAEEKLAELYVYIIQSDTVVDKVAKELQINNAKEIKESIKAKAVEGIQAFTVTVTHPNPDTAEKIANAIARIAPDEVVKIVEGGGIKVIDYAKVPKKPSSPNLKRNILIGALAGFVLSFAAFFIYEVFDTSITETKDLVREFDIPVLGTIPRLDSKSNADKSSRTEAPVSAKTEVQPSDSLLKSIQSVKGEVSNEQKK